MKRVLTLGERVTIKNLQQTYLVLGVGEDVSTVDLITEDGPPWILNNVSVSEVAAPREQRQKWPV